MPPILSVPVVWAEPKSILLPAVPVKDKVPVNVGLVENTALPEPVTVEAKT